MKRKILIIDDHLKLYKSLARNFKHLGYQTVHAQNGNEALALCAQDEIHAALLDIMLGHESGVDVLEQLLTRHPKLPVVMITGYGSIDTAVQSIKRGAFDYVTKPLDFDKLVNILENALNAANLPEETRRVAPRGKDLFPEIVTHNPAMLELCQKTRKLAATDLPVLITGENGTGKEIIADLIHLHSPRRAHPLLKINCAAFPETLLDNELFGHEKGSYTGADSAFKGVFERADQGSLFLDEIGDMPLTIQAKILRALQNHEIRRIGGERTITVDVRFIAATNKDLHEQIEHSAFRRDLFYRLNTAMLHLPPLRKRKEDIPLLVAHFLREHAHAHAAPGKTVSAAVLERFIDYDWPGNVRELKNTVNYAAALCSEEMIQVDDLPPNFISFETGEDAENVRDEIEKNLILKALQKTNYNKKKTAEYLNMSRTTLYAKLQKYGLTLPK
ncbi:two component, sigma54 specific, transcriptional regulator, Fis family [Candidatus Vecturithrix granuli]|uniref:Two component, sigma54 specific, transcriptional regulator, Fis family n=1 Tax=Vecturithrix granuli TaxID=1499967 RepID=A0A0S6WAN6_VECG1|nr:two component, sigma54 specific, transcriptional regulator, Fis family [Candidatus Vecturithrix granuli]